MLLSQDLDCEDSLERGSASEVRLSRSDGFGCREQAEPLVTHISEPWTQSNAELSFQHKVTRPYDTTRDSSWRLTKIIGPSTKLPQSCRVFDGQHQGTMDCTSGRQIN